jgi:VanZ family protein
LRNFVRYWLPALTWSAVLIAAAGDTFSAQGTGGILGSLIGSIVGGLPPETFHALHVAVRKLGHLVAYGTLGALFLRAVRGPRAGWQQRWMWIAFALTLCVAVTDEVRQSTTRTREGSPADVAIDLSGAAIAQAVMRRRAVARRTG